MTRLVGMASNRGRNLLNLDDRRPAGATFSVIVTNDGDAPVLEKASDRDIPTEVVEHAEGESRESHEERILDRMENYDVDLVCLDGYMRVLTDTFLDAIPVAFNIHPSLLPAFEGTDAHQQVIDSGVKVSGCTVHAVTEEVDAGPIITQEPLPVYEGDTVGNLKRRVLVQGEFKAYPRAVGWFAADRLEIRWDAGEVYVVADGSGDFPARRFVSEDRAASLRYGENPHQEAALYADVASKETDVIRATQRNESAKDLSYNNYNDADAALDLVKEFDEPAAAVIKHTNPAGCAKSGTIADAYDRALSTDPMSAFGGIVALNRVCDAETAEQITDSFKELVVAPGYTRDALEVLRERENLRILDTDDLTDRRGRIEEKQIVGGRLVQQRDLQSLSTEDLKPVTERAPSGGQMQSMLFAWQTAKHVKSNAIVFAKGTETVGIGMGQVSRVDAVRLAAMKADEHAEGKSAEGAVMASDGFFPFPDGIEVAAEAGVEAVIQPGGSVNDEEVIDAADELGVTMAFTEKRCFRHD